jgi:hypothetical protein
MTCEISEKSEISPTHTLNLNCEISERCEITSACRHTSIGHPPVSCCCGIASPSRSSSSNAWPSATVSLWRLNSAEISVRFRPSGRVAVRAGSHRPPDHQAQIQRCIAPVTRMGFAMFFLLCVLLLTQRVPVWTKRWGEIPQPSDEYALRAV